MALLSSLFRAFFFKQMDDRARIASRRIGIPRINESRDAGNKSRAGSRYTLRGADLRSRQWTRTTTTATTDSAFSAPARKNVDERENPRARWLNLGRTLGPTPSPTRSNDTRLTLLFCS